MPLTSSSLTPQEQTAPPLSEILATLSFALDLTEGAVPGHGVRSCLLGLRIGQALGLGADELEQLYYASLLKDVGCSSNAARMCQIVGGDDRAVKAGAKLEDWTRPNRPKLSTLKLMWNNVLPGATALSKTQRIFKIARTQHENNREMIQLRCDRGASIVRKIGFHDGVADSVRRLDEHWDGSGYPDRQRGQEIPVSARIMGVAQHLDAFCGRSGVEKAIDAMLDRNRRWFDPEIVQTTLSLHRTGRLWRDCLPEDGHEAAHKAVLQLEAAQGEKLADAGIDQICEAFSEVVDAKSPFTYRHSVGVKDAALLIGRSMGLAPERLQMLRRAALLHDLGKLSVSNMILDKPGKLDDAEFRVVKRHSALTREILDRMPSFHEIAVIAGEHHEKLDGSGYPYGLTADQLSIESRLIAVADVYGALAEDRPYRPGLDPDEITRILAAQTPQKLDPVCFEALQAARFSLAKETTPVSGSGAPLLKLRAAIAPVAAQPPQPAGVALLPGL